jgi:hypothetical protein
MKRRIGWRISGIGGILVASLLFGSSSVAAQDSVYEVVSPLGRSTVKIVPSSPRLSSLEGKKIGLVWNVFTNGDILANALAELLNKRFEHIDSVRLPSGKGLKWGSYPELSIKDVIKEAKIDALISTVGG